MAKMNNQEIKKELTPAYKGSISTVIITVFILGFGWFFPMIIADRLESTRRGEGFQDLTPYEDIIYDLNSIDDLRTIRISHYSNSHWNAGKWSWGSWLGTFTSPFEQPNTYPNYDVYGTYQYMGVKTTDSYVSSYRNVRKNPTFIFKDDVFPEQSKTVDNYATMILTNDVKMQGTTMRHVVGSTYWNNKHWWAESDERFRTEQLHVYCKTDLQDWLDGDATKVHALWKFSSHTNSWAVLPQVATHIGLIDKTTGSGITIQSWVYHQVTSNPMVIELTEELTVSDLIAIENYLSTRDSENIVLKFMVYGAKTTNSMDQRRACFLPGSEVIFDAQVYGLVTPEAEEKPFLSTMDKFSIYMILQSIGLFILGIAMLPQFTMGGIFKRLGLLEKNKD
ncbi:MAG: hypothetical protein ACTSQL_07380 [Promethearchaeota archaeon]